MGTLVQKMIDCEEEAFLLFLTGFPDTIQVLDSDSVLVFKNSTDNKNKN